MQYENLLLDFSLDSRGRSNLVRLRVFSGEEEMYAAANIRRTTLEGEKVLLPPELFSPTSDSKPAKRDRPRDMRVDAEFARDAGKALWDSLPSSVRQRMAAVRDQPLCVKISSEVRSIFELPWEWLNDGGEPFALRADWRIVRSVPARYAAPPAVVPLPLRILFVAPNPKDESLMNVAAEIDAISQALDPSVFLWSVLDKPTLPALTESLQAAAPHIVHYVGHAGVSQADGNLILHDDNVSHWVDSTTLSHLLPSSVRLLCLSTCYTTRNYQIAGLERLAEAPAFTTLPNTIVNRFTLREGAVRAFWSVFYDRLMKEDGNVVEVFHQARRNAGQPNFGFDWSSFALIIRNNHGRSFEIATSGTDDPKRLAARAIRAQFKADVLNQLAEQMKVIGSDASDDVLERLQRSIASVDKYTTTSEE